MSTNLIALFTRHRVACNLLMVMMLLVGIYALSKLNRQFFPNFQLDFVSVGITWTGASPEDVETGLTNVVEEELRTVDGLNKMTSESFEGRTRILLEYKEGADMTVALDQVQERVSLIRNLPAEAEEPQISRVVRYEPIARLLVHGPENVNALKSIARDIERDLLDRGIASVRYTGLPEEEIAVQVSSQILHELELTLDELANRISASSIDLPAGNVGREDVSRQLRALQQQRREIDFEQLPIASDANGRLLRLGDIADIERRVKLGQIEQRYGGKLAIEMQLSRTEAEDTLDSAQILNQWLEEERPKLPRGVEIEVYDETWELIWDRISLLLRNGGGGLALVLIVLFLFLNSRVAFWVAVGIPVSFMASLGVLYALGGSINMISLFALIMALGIIVDDAIVVGEDALAQYEKGANPTEAAEKGAMRMLAPVMSSSLTTIAAFLPLMLVSGIIGNILFDIPLIIVCVIIASLVESFLVLPGHLRHALQHVHTRNPGAMRRRLDNGFAFLRDRIFRPIVTWCVIHAWRTVCIAFALLMLAAGLIAAKQVQFTFFPSPEATIVYANASFVAGTPAQRVREFLEHVEEAAHQANEQFDDELIAIALTTLKQTASTDGRGTRVADHFGNVTVQLTEPDDRATRNPDFIKAWRERVQLPAGIESFTIVERRGGPPGRDVDIRLIGDDADTLKAASLQLTRALESVRGVSGVGDDMPFGQQQLIFELTAQGRALGLTTESIGRQLRAAYDGRIAQIFQDGDDEVEVRVMLPDSDRFDLSSLERFNVILPNAQGTIPLASAVQFKPRRGFEILKHTNGQLSLRVSGDVDTAVTNSNDVIARLEVNTLPKLTEDYDIRYVFEGRRADQQETLGDMARGMFFALIMIYLVLAWVFGYYMWPFVVLLAIPFGLIGAITGHWLLGIDLTILSLFGMFGLSGIVVNDSIILIMFYKELRAQGAAVAQAMIDAACQRLRAVLLTSLTTIGGLLPLMFETSLQAQFLIPMAVSISFGLAFSTVLVLLVTPAFMCAFEDIMSLFTRKREPDTAPQTQPS